MVGSGICQNQLRIVTKTARNGHEVSGFKGPNDKELLYYVDDEKIPFTGKFVEYGGWKGELTCETTYKNGKLEGDYIHYSTTYCNETKRDSTYVEEKGLYHNNKKVGRWVGYYAFKGEVRKETNYDSKGNLNGQSVSYRGIGEIESLVYYKNGVRDSIWTWYYSNGKVSRIEEYKNGKENNRQIEYYENGNKKSEVTYKDGKKQGTSNRWYDNGQIQYSCIYLNDKMEGLEVKYNKNGQKESEGNYVLGEKKGKFIWYNSDGSVSEETEYK